MSGLLCVWQRTAARWTDIRERAAAGQSTGQLNASHKGPNEHSSVSPLEEGKGVCAVWCYRAVSAGKITKCGSLEKSWGLGRGTWGGAEPGPATRCFHPNTRPFSAGHLLYDLSGTPSMLSWKVFWQNLSKMGSRPFWRTGGVCEPSTASHWAG